MKCLICYYSNLLQLKSVDIYNCHIKYMLIYRMFYQDKLFVHSVSSYSSFARYCGSKSAHLQVPRDKMITLTIELNRVGWSFYLAVPVKWCSLPWPRVTISSLSSSVNREILIVLFTLDSNNIRSSIVYPLLFKFPRKNLLSTKRAKKILAALMFIGRLSFDSSVYIYVVGFAAK